MPEDRINPVHYGALYSQAIRGSVLQVIERYGHVP
jgi:hypothetical protein